jgi:hypothetical protein
VGRDNHLQGEATLGTLMPLSQRCGGGHSKGRGRELTDQATGGFSPESLCGSRGTSQAAAGSDCELSSTGEAMEQRCSSIGSYSNKMRSCLHTRPAA